MRSDMFNPPPENPDDRIQHPSYPEARPARPDYDEGDYGAPRSYRRWERLPSDSDLSTGDWVLCVLCSGIGCIVGIVRLIQGAPNGGKMVGVSLLFMFLWTVMRLFFLSLLEPRGAFP